MAVDIAKEDIATNPILSLISLFGSRAASERLQEVKDDARRNFNKRVLDIFVREPEGMVPAIEEFLRQNFPVEKSSPVR